MKSIILASASPRRKELLSQIGIEYEVIPSNTEEIITSALPCEIVMELAKQKAEDIEGKINTPGKIVLGADTIVAFNDKVMGKPSDKDAAVAMISMLENATHQVYTGVSLSYLKENGEDEKATSQFRIALKIMEAFEEDFLETKWFVSRVCEYMSEQRDEVKGLLGIE